MDDNKNTKKVIYLDECLKDINYAKSVEELEIIYNNQQLFGGFTYDKNDGMKDIYLREAYNCRNKGMSFSEMLDSLKSIRICFSSDTTLDKTPPAPSTTQNDEMAIKNHPIKSTVLFWVCVMFSPFLIYLLSYISYAFVGGTDGLFFMILMYCFQGLGCGLGYMFAVQSSPNSKAPLVNISICIALFAVFAWSSFNVGNIDNAISMFVGVIIMIGCIIKTDSFRE